VVADYARRLKTCLVLPCRRAGTNPALCGADGRGCQEHARAGQCPLGHYENPPAALPVVGIAEASGGWAELGAALWRELHAKGGDADEAYLADFARRVPCGDCRLHWLEAVARTPPVFGAGWFAWTVDRHNEVNRRLGKRELTIDEARAAHAEGGQGGAAAGAGRED
jgi:hypothetical protein